MKILFDATPMIVNRTGIAIYTERLVVQMAKQYPDIELVGFYYNFLGRRDTSHLPRLKNLRYMSASLVPSKIVFQLRRWGIEVPVEALALQRGDFVLFPNILGYPSLFHTPNAPVIHDLTYIDLPEYVTKKLRADLVRFIPKQIKRSQFVVTVSEFTKQRIIDYYGLPPEKVVVTPIPAEPWESLYQAKKDQVLKELGVNKPFILFVGTIEPRKNIINLIDGYLAMPKDLRHKYQLVIAGRVGWYCDKELAKLKEVAAAGHNVLHLGYVSEEAKSVLYQSASLFSSASHYEGFGMPVLEALNYGIPSAVSDIPIFREIASDAAVYYDASRPEDIADCFTKLLRDDKRLVDLGHRGREHAEKYSWEKVATTLYDAILANQDQPPLRTSVRRFLCI